MKESLKLVFGMIGISTAVLMEILFFNWLFDINWVKAGMDEYTRFVMYFTVVNFILAIIAGIIIGIYGSSKKLV